MLVFSRKVSIRLAGLFVAALLLSPAQAKTNGEFAKIRNAVVKIYTTINAPDYFTPWTMLNASQSSGSGSIIAGKRILTNAHVVADASFIQVQRQGDTRKYIAKVDHVSHETDLAILTVADESFFQDSVALKIGKLPQTLDNVRVYGFPIGGKTLSITKGVLSRVEHQYFAHGNGYFLAGQIDAAINPGNSGGPVIANGKIVGVVMQANYSDNSENLGYFVPPSVIEHVLTDVEDGQYDGFRRLGLFTQSMESPAMKNVYGLEENESGVLITHVLPGSPAAQVLQANDVILKIDDFDVADDETINFRENQRTHYKYAIDQHQQQEGVTFEITRNGQKQSVTVPPGPEVEQATLVRGERFGELPEYYIYGGVLFVPLNMNLIKRWGKNWRQKAPIEFLEQRNIWADETRQEAVVALKILPANVNRGYHNWRNWVVDSINGEKVRNFDHLATLLHNNTKPDVVLKDKSGYQMIINHQHAVDSLDEILQRYRIPAQFSVRKLQAQQN